MPSGYVVAQHIRFFLWVPHGKRPPCGNCGEGGAEDFFLRACFVASKFPRCAAVFPFILPIDAVMENDYNSNIPRNRLFFGRLFRKKSKYPSQKINPSDISRNYLEIRLNKKAYGLGGNVMYLAFKALADRTRRDILTLLSRGDLAAGEIAGRFNMSWPSVSHHLMILKRAGLVTCTRDRQSYIYSMRADGLRDMMGWMSILLQNKEGCREETPVKK